MYVKHCLYGVVRIGWSKGKCRWAPEILFNASDKFVMAKRLEQIREVCELGKAGENEVVHGPSGSVPVDCATFKQFLSKRQMEFSDIG